jgi:hypothetical protein
MYFIARKVKNGGGGLLIKCDGYSPEPKAQSPLPSWFKGASCCAFLPDACILCRSGVLAGAQRRFFGCAARAQQQLRSSSISTAARSLGLAAMSSNTVELLLRSAATPRELLRPPMYSQAQRARAQEASPVPLLLLCL